MAAVRGRQLGGKPQRLTLGGGDAHDAAQDSRVLELPQVRPGILPDGAASYM